MEILKSTIFLPFLILTSQAIHAASKPFPGYFITNNGDTVNCKIEYGDWYRNPETISVEVNNARRVLGVGDIKGFGVEGYGDYRTAAVTYHINPINGTELPDQYSDSTMTKTVFLKVLIKGAYSLYELELTERKYFFLQKNDGAISELLYRVANKDGEIKEDRQYANLLAGLFLEEGILDKYKGKVYSAAYNSDIPSLVKLLNGDHSSIKNVKTASGRMQVGVFAGGIINLFPSDITGMFPHYGKIGPAGSFSGGVNLLYITAGHFEAFKVGMSIGYNRYSGTGSKTDSLVDRRDPNDWFATTYTEHLSVTNTMIMLNLYATYALNPADRTKFYLKVGLSYGIGKSNAYVLNDYKTIGIGFNSGRDLSSSTHATEQVIPISNGIPNPIVGAGIENGRHKLEVSYYYPMDASSSSSQTFKIGMVGFNYYYTILK